MRTLIVVVLFALVSMNPVVAGEPWKRGTTTKIKEQAAKQNPGVNPKLLHEKMRSKALGTAIDKHQSSRMRTKSPLVRPQGSEATRQTPRPVGVRAFAILQGEPGHAVAKPAVVKPAAPKVSAPKATATPRRPSVSAGKPIMPRRPPSVTIRKQ